MVNGFVYYIIATMLDGSTKKHSFKNVIGPTCSEKYITMMGEILDFSNFTERTIHKNSSSDPPLGDIIHETNEKSQALCQACLKKTYIPGVDKKYYDSCEDLCTHLPQSKGVAPWTSGSCPDTTSTDPTLCCTCEGTPTCTQAQLKAESDFYENNNLTHPNGCYDVVKDGGCTKANPKQEKWLKLCPSLLWGM